MPPPLVTAAELSSLVIRCSVGGAMFGGDDRTPRGVFRRSPPPYTLSHFTRKNIKKGLTKSLISDTI